MVCESRLCYLQKALLSQPSKVRPKTSGVQLLLQDNQGLFSIFLDINEGEEKNKGEDKKNENTASAPLKDSGHRSSSFSFILSLQSRR